MKPFFLKFILLFITVITIDVTAQNATIQNILSQANLDSLVYFDKQLSGDVTISLGGIIDSIKSRNKYQADNHKAALFIKSKFESYGIPTTLQSFSSTGENVLGTKVGTKYPNQKIIICAHYDDMPSGSYAPGSDDNGSGSSAVIEAARIFHDYSFPYTIVFAAWDEEEQGLVGSAYFANNISATDTIVGVVNMDMIAYDSNNDGKCEIHKQNKGQTNLWAAKMAELNTVYGIGLNTVLVDPGSTSSDHSSFWDKNITAILLIENYVGGDFNSQYHQTGDRISLFNLPYYLKMAKLSYATLANYALDLNLAIAHTPVISAAYTGNILTSANINTSLPVGSGSNLPRLYYRTNSGGTFGSFNYVQGVRQGTTNTFNFILPTQNQGVAVQYYIAAQDSAGNLSVTLPGGGSGINPPGFTPPQAFYDFLIADPFYAFSDTITGLTHYVAEGGWGLGTTKYVSAPYSLTESPTGNYLANADAKLTIDSVFNLTGLLRAQLEFDTQWATEPDYDYCQVQATTNNGTTWTSLSGNFTHVSTSTHEPAEPLYDGTQAAWVHEIMNLNQFLGSSVKLRFRFVSDNSLQYDGWYVDNIKVVTYGAVTPVELSAFTVSRKGNKIALNWTTSTETNNKGFSVQRSKDKAVWESLTF
ncbi:MAG: M20/M25/M40 family metallo-hydrolase, partial [Bacteroidota bacterium]|nr:M20/M25/M40 family metallo-hydrolase [Bacteroidota bacterium]